MTAPANPLPQLIYTRVRKLQQTLEQETWAETTDLEVETGPLNKKWETLAGAKQQKWKRIPNGDIFAPQQGQHGEYPWWQRWFRVKIPAAKRHENGSRHLEWLAHGETTVYIDGTPWAGLDCCHLTCPLPDKACTLWLECGIWQSAIWLGRQPPDQHGFRFEHAKLQVRDPLAWDVHHDISILFEWIHFQYEQLDLPIPGRFGHMQRLDKASPLLRRMLKRLNDACDAYDNGGLAELKNVCAKIFKEFPTEKHAFATSYVGHAHIDLVWLWPERVADKKGIHTFATILRLMERYPEFTFSMSQPPLIYNVRNDEPELAQQIQKRIDEGRWEFTGGLEVESDTQLPVGEGLIRSIVYGQQRIEAIRGEFSNTAWIPDVFGYSQCLPQLFQLGRIKYFYTTKMTWCEVTKFPHNSFTWKSPDGSEVLTHLAATGYLCEVRIPEATAASQAYRQADVHSEMLIAAGYGDGGGGATDDHCERARRMADLAGVPRTSWTTAEDFFERLAKVQDQLPRFRGELYMENHRGVQTTQSDLKFYFRACERALQTREAVRAIRGLSALKAADWERYVFAQFHDAIPGSSIHSVYEELNPELAQIAETNLEAAVSEWGSTKAYDGSITAINQLALDRQVTIQLPLDQQKGKVQQKRHKDSQLVSDDAEVVPHQVVGTGKDQHVIARLSLDALASHRFRWQKTKAVESVELTATPRRLDNGLLDARFNAGGALTTLTVGGNKMQLESPAGFWLHVDRPANWDAWNIDHPATWCAEPVARQLSLEVVEQGAVRAVLRGEAKFGESSHLTLDYVLESGADVLKIVATVDWQEDHRLLRYQLQTGYRGEIARFGAPFGSTDRSQVEGQDGDEALWEVPGSRWAAVLDGRGEGLALITEAKYGFNAREGRLGVSLLRSPCDPDPIADRGRHVLRFSVGQHRDVIRGDGLSTAAQAESLYTPPLVVPGGTVHNAPVSFEDLGSVVPSWVAPSSTGEGMIVRLHEVAGARQVVRMNLDEAASDLQAVDLFEAPLDGPSPIRQLSPTSYDVAVGAYKIVTVLLRR